MTIKLLPLVVAYSLFILFSNSAKAQINIGDSLALVDFYDSTHNRTWAHEENWLTAAPVSTWYGITVTNNRVTAINLSANGLDGYLPESFSKLKMLQYVDLSWSNLHKGLPHSIGNLTNLVSVNVSHNYKLTGKIPPSIGNCSNLQYLNMYITHTFGQIPAEMGNLTNLTYLELGLCKLIDTIPASLGNLKNLQYLNIYNNKLTGSIPASLGNLTNLQALYLSLNELSGTIPPALGSCKNLRILGLNYNRLTGSIPPELEKLDSCTSLDLSENRLTGSIPPELGNLYNLKELQLDYNRLSGSIPIQLGNLNKLYYLYISNNYLTGEIPLSLLKLKSLTIIYANHNKLTYNSNDFVDTRKKFFELAINDNNYTFNGIEFVVSRYANTVSLNYSPQSRIPIHKYKNKMAVSAGGTLSNNTYYWYEAASGKSTAIVGDSTFQPTVSGRYSAAVTNKIAKNLILYTDTVTYTLPLVKSELSLSLYPNPVKNVLSLNGLDEKEILKITIADISGTVHIILNSAYQSTVKINVSKLKSGNYLVNVNNGKTIKAVQFIKE